MQRGINCRNPRLRAIYIVDNDDFCNILVTQLLNIRMAVQNQPAGLLAAEGLFSYFCERLPSLLSFSAEYCSRIVLAEVKKGPGAGSYVLWNVHTTIFIYNSGLNERVSKRTLLQIMQ